LKELAEEEAKRPPQPPLPDGSKILTQKDLIEMDLRAVPECSAEIEKARSELEDVTDLDEFPDWARHALLSFAYWLFGPPIAALVIGTSLIWAFGWAFRGFRAR
jgi:hypothetical protein